MYPTLALGPLSLPTGPLITIFAVLFGLDVATRYGRRLSLVADDVWNAGLFALLAGLIAARLWNILQFWEIYLSEPFLTLSIRPSGFVLWPGLIAALLVGYGWLIRKAMEPVHTAAAFAMGALAAGTLLHIGAYLTGTTVGTLSEPPWALLHFGELRHPVALYQAVGTNLLLILLWATARKTQPGRTILLAGLGYALLRLFTDAFVEDATLLGTLRTSQIMTLSIALLCSLLLANNKTDNQK
jgi:phosphatidylglycerol---prolipoprotein diacylglyceryl transferase